LRLDHISTSLTLLIEGPFHDAVIALLTPGRALEEVATIWSACEPHIRAPPSHPHIGGAHARDTIIAMLCTEYNTTDNVKGDAHAFLDLVAASIPPETSTAHTGVTLTEEEMAVGLPPFSHLSSRYTTVRILITGAHATVISHIGLSPNGYLYACS